MAGRRVRLAEVGEQAVESIEPRDSLNRVDGVLDGFDRLFAHFGQPHASPRHFPPPPRRSGLEAATPIPAANTSRLGRSLSRHGVSARLASPERLDRALADDNSCDENATILV